MAQLYGRLTIIVNLVQIPSYVIVNLLQIPILYGAAIWHRMPAATLTRSVNLVT